MAYVITLGCLNSAKIAVFGFFEPILTIFWSRSNLETLVLTPKLHVSTNKYC